MDSSKRPPENDKRRNERTQETSQRVSTRKTQTQNAETRKEKEGKSDEGQEIVLTSCFELLNGEEFEVNGNCICFLE